MDYTQDRHRDEEEETDGRSVAEFDCDYCDEVLRTETVAAMQERGMAHLETHEAQLLDVFADKERGKDCQNDCGYVFPVGVDDVTGFDCPECGFDNFEAFARRYLYWQIEFL